jgi:glycosyltransferase involved in cell wall biosynthesis
MQVWYFPLESLKSRYTKQLCEEWIPSAFHTIAFDTPFRIVRGQEQGDDVRVGQVLDATGRGVYATTQVAAFLEHIARGDVKDGDVLYFQDFWTPGIEAIPYALHLHGIKTRQYAMLHAQSVDEYDFTHPMLPWIRHFELGIDAWLTGIFVASSIHRDQLKRANFRAPIHVVGLPISVAHVHSVCRPGGRKAPLVVFTSRLDREKNPRFMAEVARAFLETHDEWNWAVTTSASIFRSNDPKALITLQMVTRDFPDRFHMLAGLSKEDYYQMLRNAAIQFNCASQDYVSWTLLEASAFGCDLAYPNFRSFPECVPPSRLYRYLDVADALRVLRLGVADARRADFIPGGYQWIAGTCDAGRMTAARIMIKDEREEFTLWGTRSE